MIANLSLVYPMFALVLFTVVVLLWMFRARVRAVKQGEVTMKYFKNYEATGNLPEDVIRTQRHFTNLFEVPVLFYAGCVVAMIIPIHGLLILFWAWSYVICRVIHGVIHIHTNRLQPRMLSYGMGWLALLGLWLHIVFVVMTTT